MCHFTRATACAKCCTASWSGWLLPLMHTACPRVAPRNNTCRNNTCRNTHFSTTTSLLQHVMSIQCQHASSSEHSGQGLGVSLSCANLLDLLLQSLAVLFPAVGVGCSIVERRGNGARCQLVHCMQTKLVHFVCHVRFAGAEWISTSTFMGLHSQ